MGSTHDWILFFTNKGRVYRSKAYELPEANRTARGQHVANILAFQPDEKIAQVMQIKDYSVAPYLALATARGQVKKTRLTDFDSPRQGGVIAINLRDGDELVGAVLIEPDQDLLLVTRKAMSIRFTADDVALRPMGRATEGVRGISLSDDDRLLSMMVVQEGVDVLVATERGFAKRTGIENYPNQGRGGKGVLTADPKARKGALVGALAVTLGDELYAITSSGGVIRTPVNGVRHNKDRATMGVKLMNLPEDVSIVAIARTTDNDEPDGLMLSSTVRPDRDGRTSGRPARSRASGPRRWGTGDWHERPDAEFGAHRVPRGRRRRAGRQHRAGRAARRSRPRSRSPAPGTQRAQAPATGVRRSRAAAGAAAGAPAGHRRSSGARPAPARRAATVRRRRTRPTPPARRTGVGGRAAAGRRRPAAAARAAPACSCGTSTPGRR